MSRNTWDAVLASTPLNSTAGRVTSGGVHYEPAISLKGPEWDAPPAIVRPSVTHLNNPCFIDMTGHKVGRLTVLGMSGLGGDRALWVCRCSCGKYVGRRAKALKNPANSGDRCSACHHTAGLIKSASGDNARLRASDTTKRRWTLP